LEQHRTVKTLPSKHSGFSIAELLVVLLVLGIVLYFAFPNIVQVKSDSERELAKARADALNLAAAAYVQTLGGNFNAVTWSNLSDEQRYTNLMPYIAFPATSLSNFLPSADYSVTFDRSAPHKVKAVLKGPGGTTIPY
jgi:prepilin-type N-terminal cleavage/methylation domain-containing protein